MYYIKYTQNNKEYKETFDTIPKDIYWACGYQCESDKGKGFVSRFTDYGTTLIPVIVNETDKQLMYFVD